MAFFTHKAEFFDIPEDVLLYVIYPFLNYEERINFNQILPRTIKGQTKLKNTFKFDSDVQEMNILFHKLDPIAFGNKERIFYITKLFFRLQNSPILQHDYLRKILTRKCKDLLDDPRLTPTLRRLINNINNSRE